MPSPAQVLSGGFYIQMVARLSSSAPLPVPLRTNAIREASFPGYSPSLVSVYTQNTDVAGNVSLSGEVQFLNLGLDLNETPSALFLTTVNQTPLMAVLIPLTPAQVPKIPSGPFKITFNAMAFVLPGIATNGV